LKVQTELVSQINIKRLMAFDKAHIVGSDGKSKAVILNVECE
jgi:hypothetical protein